MSRAKSIEFNYSLKHPSNDPDEMENKTTQKHDTTPHLPTLDKCEKWSTKSKEETIDGVNILYKVERCR